MRKIIAALVLGVAMLLPAAAFAGDEAGTDQDHATSVTGVIQTEPIQLGTLSGSDNAPFTPYFELRQDNYGN